MNSSGSDELMLRRLVNPKGYVDPVSGPSYSRAMIYSSIEPDAVVIPLDTRILILSLQDGNILV